MKISVIVPYWNSGAWIGRNCESLKAQRGDFEFLLVDDHSTDRGKDIVLKYAHDDDRFRVLDNLRTKGVSGARNTGIDYATGDWITFLDADDELMPKAYLAYERMTWADPTANIIQANHMRNYGRANVHKYDNREGLYSFGNMPQQWCMVWNKLIRRSWLGNLRFVEGMQYGEDEVFVLDMLSRDERLFHTEDIAVLRHFDNAQSLSRSKGKEELLLQARALEDFLVRSKNPQACIWACEVLSEHWGSKRYKTTFGK